MSYSCRCWTRSFVSCVIFYLIVTLLLPSINAEENQVIDVYETKHPEYLQAKEEVLSRGADLTVEEFYQIAEKYKIDVSGLIKLWKILAAFQNPDITKEDLRSLVLAKRNSVSDITCSYHIGNNSYKYAYKSDKQFYIERDELNETRFHEVRSLNKKDYRKVLFPESDSASEAAMAVADILPLKGGELEEGECLEMPLFQAMLFDTKFFGFEYWFVDLGLHLEKYPLCCIFERYQDVDGHRCLVLADLYSQIYLDADKDFSLYKFVDYRVIENKDKDESALPFTRYINTSRTMHDLKDYGNGIWLPSRVETKSYRPDGTVGLETNIVYDEIIINVGIPDRFFEDVIPDGAIVLDGIRKMTYKWGDRPSIGSLIKETVKSKRQTIFRNLSVVCGLCFLACWGFIEWRKKRLLKENKG